MPRQFYASASPPKPSKKAQWMERGKCQRSRTLTTKHGPVQVPLGCAPQSPTVSCSGVEAWLAAWDAQGHIRVSNHLLSTQANPKKKKKQSNRAGQNLSSRPCPPSQNLSLRIFLLLAFGSVEWQESDWRLGKIYFPPLRTQRYYWQASRQLPRHRAARGFTSVLLCNPIRSHRFCTNTSNLKRASQSHFPYKTATRSACVAFSHRQGAIGASVSLGAIPLAHIGPFGAGYATGFHQYFVGTNHTLTIVERGIRELHTLLSPGQLPALTSALGAAMAAACGLFQISKVA